MTLADLVKDGYIKIGQKFAFTIGKETYHGDFKKVNDKVLFFSRGKAAATPHGIIKEVRSVACTCVLSH